MQLRLILILLATLIYPLSSPAFTYDESLDGDIASSDENSPTPLGTGENVIMGSVSYGTDWGDCFSLILSSGYEIPNLYIQISNHTGGFNASTKLFTVPYVGIESHVTPNSATLTYTAPPLSPDVYGFNEAFNSMVE